MTTTWPTYTATYTSPDGQTHEHTRHGKSRRFVVYGRDAVGVRKDERSGVSEWCTTKGGAEEARDRWQQRYGGEWTVLPVTYRDEQA